MTLTGTCETCRHGIPSLVQPDAIDCRRFPPTLTVVMVPARHELSGQTTLAPQAHTIFPTVGKETSCGEWGRDLAAVVMNQ